MRHLYLTLAFNICLFSFAYAQLPSDLDSLLVGYEQAPNDSVKFLYADELFWQYVYKDLEKSKPFIEASLSLADRLQDSTKQVTGLNSYAIYYRISGQYRKGDSVLRKAIQISERLKDTIRLSRSYGNLSNILTGKGDFEGSIEADLQAMRFYEALGDSAGIGICLNNVGRTHFALKQYQESLEYYQQALVISQQIQDTLGLAQNLGNIGTAEKQLGNLDKALEAYLSAKELFEQLGYKRNVSFTLNNIALLYREKKAYKKAENYLLQCLALLQERNSPLDMANIYDNLAKTALLQGKYTQGLAYANKAWNRVQEVNARPVLRKVYQSLSKAHAGKKDFRTAYEFQQKFIALNDSLINEGNTQKIQEMEARYEAEAREKEILVLNKDKEVQAQTIEAQKAVLRARNAVILGALFALGLAIFASLFYRQKQLLAQKEKDLAAQRNRELKSQQQIIRMDALIQGEESERRRIAQDLHDGIGSMLASAKLQVSTLTEKVPNTQEIRETQSLLGSTYEEVRRIAHNMMPKILLELGLIPAVKHLGENLERTGYIDVHINALSDWPTLPDHEELILYRIIQEVLNNIQKHAHATEAWIQFSHFEGESSILIEDNGVGFDPNSDKEGIGLESMHNRVAYLNGELEIDSQPNKGTAVTIRIPDKTNKKLGELYETHHTS